jgi:hypothetical protein
MGRINIIVLSAIVFLLISSPSQAKYSGGTGEPNAPYRIATPNDLNDVANHVEDFNKCFVLVNDVNMRGLEYSTALIAPDTNTGGEFQGTAFTGIFEGNDHVISNLAIDTAGADNAYLGLFGLLGETSEVRNLGIEDVNITGADFSYRVGGLCGCNYGTISNCHGGGDVSGNSGVGGLCGFNDGVIRRCYAISTVSGADVYSPSLGGLCGFNYRRGTIGDSYAGGSVSGYSFLGGLCGYNREGTISTCYATSSVKGVVQRGGLCGGKDSSATITNCYWLHPADGGGPNNGLGTPLTDTQMKQQDSFSGWDFIEIWDIGEGQTYPFLRTHSPGDLNHDGMVGWQDVAIVAFHWLEGTE